MSDLGQAGRGVLGARAGMTAGVARSLLLLKLLCLH